MEISGKSILIVDDEVDLCQVISWEFEDLGMNVYQAHSGNSAIKILKAEAIDFLLTDIKMPDGDGVDLLKMIKECSIDLTSLYMMTGYTDYSDEDLKKLGMTKLYRKPLDIEEIVDHMQAL